MKRRIRALICFVLALSLTFYAVPRLPFQQGTELASWFSVVWLFFAALAIGANLNISLGEKRTVGKPRSDSYYQYRFISRRPIRQLDKEKRKRISIDL